MTTGKPRIELIVPLSDCEQQAAQVPGGTTVTWELGDGKQALLRVAKDAAPGTTYTLRHAERSLDVTVGALPNRVSTTRTVMATTGEQVQQALDDFAQRIDDAQPVTYPSPLDPDLYNRPTRPDPLPASPSRGSAPPALTVHSATGPTAHDWRMRRAFMALCTTQALVVADMFAILWFAVPGGQLIASLLTVLAVVLLGFGLNALAVLAMALGDERMLCESARWMAQLRERDRDAEELEPPAGTADGSDGSDGSDDGSPPSESLPAQTTERVYDTVPTCCICAASDNLEQVAHGTSSACVDEEGCNARMEALRHEARATIFPESARGPWVRYRVEARRRAAQSCPPPKPKADEAT